MEATGMPVALLYVEKSADPDLKGRAAQVYGDAPERFRGQLLFAVVSKDDFHYQLDEYGKTQRIEGEWETVFPSSKGLPERFQK
jgi:hypothetical protein